jgi:hypothetical protein
VVAQRGAALGGTIAGQGQPSVVQLSAELRQVQAEQQRTPASDRQQALARTEEAIAAQLRAANRTEEAKNEVLDRLRLLTARLDEAVTQLLELGLEQPGGSVEVSADAATGSIDALLDDIGALHEGLREAGAAAANADPTGTASPTRLPSPSSPADSHILPPVAPPSPPTAS